MDRQQYIGITLGPISRIMSYTRSTKSLWRASYFMSYLAKQLISGLYKEKRLFVKPLLYDEMWSIHDGVGRFPDQYIFQSKSGDFERLLEKRLEVLKDLGEKIAYSLGNAEKDKVFHYLEDTLKVYIIEMNDYESEENIVDECQKALSVMECRDIYPKVCERNYLAEYFESDVKENDWLVADAFEKQSSRLFLSIIECSASKAVESGDISRRDLFKDEKVAKLAPRYKYIAFVCADGDNIGKAIAKEGQLISKVLMGYSKGLTEIVMESGGQVIYSGGDDLLFFAPADCVFELICKIDSFFQKQLDDNKVMEKLSVYHLPRPSLSFGVSISYHKHPMAESIALADSLLWKAKEAGRNRIAWNLRKHSGQTVASEFDKHHAAIFEEALKLIRLDGQDEVFLHSFPHYLLLHREMLTHILSEQKPEAKLANYVKSTFEDESHEPHVDLLARYQKYLLMLAKEETDKECAINKLHTLLRYIELFKAKKITT